MDCPFLCELIEFLTTTERENACYVSGIKLPKDRVLTQIVPVELDSASMAHANANPTSCTQVLIQLHLAELPCVAMAHSHPGTGPCGTRPSSVDLRYMRNIEATGAKVIGIIVTRDFCVRFFSADLPFEIVIQGNEFQPVEEHEHVYRLDQTQE